MTGAAHPRGPVRVGTIITSLYAAGGDENRLVEHLRARDPARVDHRVAVVLAPDPAVEASPGSLRRRLAASGLVPDELGERPFRERLALPAPLAAGRAAWTTGRVVSRLAAWLRASRIEVVDARLALGTALAVAAARLAGGLPVVATTYGPRFFESNGRRWLGRAVYRAVDTLVSDSRARLDDVCAFAGRPLRCALVANGIEPPAAERGPAEMRAHLGIPPDAPVIGQIARFVAFKGQERALEALPHVLSRVPEAHLVLCGLVESSEWFESLQRDARERGLADRVHVLPWPGPIGDVWGVVDVHVHPTRYDSSPIAIVEAMSLGIPSVATDVGGIAELITDGETGRLLPADADAEALAGALVPLLRSTAARSELGRAAQARYLARHSPRSLAAAMEDLYLEVAARRAASMP